MLGGGGMGKGVLRLPVCSPPPSAQAMPSEAPPPPPPTSLSPELAISLLSPAFHLNQTNTKKQSIDGAVETSNYKSGLMGQDLPWHWALWTSGGGRASWALWGAEQHPWPTHSMPGALLVLTTTTGSQILPRVPWGHHRPQQRTAV